MAGSAGDLERTQRWLQTAITHPDRRRAGLEDIVLPSTALNSMQRLSIYSNMYFERLVAILAEEFPTVRHLIGPQVFADEVKDYVTRHPSTHYSLAQLGKHFPRFLLEESNAIAVPHREFAAAIASVERTMEDVFDERQDEPLLVEEIQTIDPDSWDQVRLKPVSALRLLQLPYPVNDYISAVRDGRRIDIPGANRTFIAVYRHDYRVWRADLNECQFTLLSELREDRTLGEALRVCAELPGSDSDELATHLFEWFRNWTAEGYFYKVEADERTA